MTPETSSNKTREFYRPFELAEKWGERTSLIYRLIRSGKIVHVHHGKKIKIPREEFIRLLKEGIQT